MLTKANRSMKLGPGIGPLTTTEETRLGELTAIVDRGFATYFEVGTALAEIRESRLYRGGAQTFEEFCEAHWQITSHRANQLMTAVDVVKEIGTVVPIPANERQARALSAAPVGKRAETLQEAIATAPEGKLTAAHINSVAERWAGKVTRREEVPAPFSHVSGPIPKPTSNRRPQAETLRHCPTCTCEMEPGEPE